MKNIKNLLIMIFTFVFLFIGLKGVDAYQSTVPDHIYNVDYRSDLYLNMDQFSHNVSVINKSAHGPSKGISEIDTEIAAPSIPTNSGLHSGSTGITILLSVTSLR